ncbi:MAG: protease modulator HflC [Clostridiaceae bacterium]|nr:protease modulator HflC [Clostridiaceae bacterium]
MQNINFEYNQQYKAQNKVKLNTEKLKDFFKNLGVAVALIIALLFVIRSFVFTVGEREQVVITQFDEIVRVIVDDIDEPSIKELKSNPRFANIKIQEGKGLFFKIPFIQSVRRFTNQILTFDTSAEEVFTKDKKTILLDNFAQWKIVNPVSFMVNIGGSRETAHLRIDEFLYSKMREEIGKIDAHVLIADKDYVMNMLENVEDYINEQVEPMGIKIYDIRIKRTEFPDATKPSIYEQMRSERQAVATEYRAVGEKQARTIRSEAERNATIIEAQAYEEAQKLMGEGDAEALRIYAEAYNVDPEFYEFWKTLQTYKSVIDDDTTIIISSDSPFAKYIFGK